MLGKSTIEVSLNLILCFFLDVFIQKLVIDILQFGIILVQRILLLIKSWIPVISFFAHILPVFNILSTLANILWSSIYFRFERCLFLWDLDWINFFLLCCSIRYCCLLWLAYEYVRYFREYALLQVADRETTDCTLMINLGLIRYMFYSIRIHMCCRWGCRPLRLLQMLMIRVIRRWL